MLQHEDSILSSPSSSKKSVRKLRNIRKSKRRVRSKGSEKEMYLQRLYEDSDSDGEILNQTFVITSRVHDYVPFEMENILVKADRYAPTDNVPNLPKQEEGFRTCESLTEQKTKDNDDQSFLITDSELLNCCHEADKAILKTPSKELCLVNSILDDFCLSPLSTAESTIRFWEYSPQFIFKNKPEKTYSRKNRRLNFKESCSDDEDALSSSSSSLFCTQVYSQLEDDLYNTTVVANVSQRLDKNLLDLTSTFTQESSPPMSDSSTRNSSPLSTFPSIRNLENLTREMCELKRRYPNRQLRLESSSSGEEGFRGFAISNVVGSGATEISLSEDDCDVGGLDETLLSPQKFHISDEDHEIVLCSDSKFSTYLTIKVNMTSFLFQVIRKKSTTHVKVSSYVW